MLRAFCGRAPVQVAPLLAIVAASAALAEQGPERYGVLVQDLPGLPSGISDVARDTDGFLWVASEEGLSRFDGSSFVRWGEPVRLEQVDCGPGPAVVAHAYGGPLYERTETSLQRVAGPGGVPLDQVQHALFDRDGNLWAAPLDGDRVLWRAPGGAWAEVALPPAPGRRSIAQSLAPHPEGGVVVGTRDGRILRLDRLEAARLVADRLDGSVIQVASDPAGQVAANVRWSPRSGVVRVTGSRVELVQACGGRPTGLVWRQGTIWSSWDEAVFAIRDGAAVERLGPAEGFEVGGSLAIDSEGSLWLTGFGGGLTRLPEPETGVWTVGKGLPHSGIRQVVARGDERFASSWRGSLRFDPKTRRWTRLLDPPSFNIDLAFGSLRDGLWTSGYRTDAAGAAPRGVLLRYGAGHLVPLGPARADAPGIKGATGPDGRLWLAYGRDLLEVAPGTTVPRRRASIPAEVEWVSAVAVSSRDELCLAGHSGPLCRLDLDGAGEVWRCAPDPALEGVMALRFVEGDALWVATDRKGVLACDAKAGCGALLGKDTLGSDAVNWLAPSPRGGTWVVGRTGAFRVVADAGAARVVERIGAAQGVPRFWFSSVHEEDDGTLWVAGLSGIARVPGSARVRESPPPAVQVTRLEVAGTPVHAGRPARAVAGQDTVALEWAALSFRDPSRLRYRFRLGANAPWSVVERPQLNLVAPESGRYRIETAASLDGVRWQSAAVPIDLRVIPPWYGRSSVWAAAGFVVLGLSYLGHRLRLAHLLRLEHQRIQIAMDLHDDLGATLGGIGLLATVASNASVEPAERQSILERIGRQSAAASSALADIVWSLRPGAGTLDQLMLVLRERATELVPNGEVRLRFAAPDPCPRTPLGVQVRRNVQWIAVEALRNAVRHASPQSIEIRLEPFGPAFRLSVVDDGPGLTGEAVPARGGMGLESMQRRAEAIGARFGIDRNAGGGTRVSVVFRPDGRPTRMII